MHKDRIKGNIPVAFRDTLPLLRHFGRSNCHVLVGIIIRLEIRFGN